MRIQAKIRNWSNLDLEINRELFAMIRDQFD